jgi:hypothetical protein
MIELTWKALLSLSKSLFAAEMVSALTCKMFLSLQFFQDAFIL